MNNASSENATIGFDVIGHIESPFDEKFLIPRQPGLVNTRAKLVLHAPYNHEVAVEGLAGISHIWLQFVFDGHKQGKTRSDLRVRPPRLGGNKKVGVFATRSSFRPNPLGLSLVKLLSIECGQNTVVLWIEGSDCLNGTQIIDIKPYLPYADVAADAENALAAQAPECDALAVTWSAKALTELQQLSQLGYFNNHDFWLNEAEFKRSLSALLALDPRPPYQKNQAETSNESQKPIKNQAQAKKSTPAKTREYGVNFSGLNIRFACVGIELSILSCAINTSQPSDAVTSL